MIATSTPVQSPELNTAQKTDESYRKTHRKKGYTSYAKLNNLMKKYDISKISDLANFVGGLTPNQVSQWKFNNSMPMKAYSRILVHLRKYGYPTDSRTIHRSNVQVATQKMGTAAKSPDQTLIVRGGFKKVQALQGILTEMGLRFKTLDEV